MSPKQRCQSTEGKNFGSHCSMQWTAQLQTLNKLMHNQFSIFQLHLHHTDVIKYYPYPYIRLKIKFTHRNEKSTQREMQTLRASCGKAEPKISPSLQTPLLGVQDGQNLMSGRWLLTSLRDPVWWRLMHTISSYRGNKPTNKQTHNTHKQTGPITIYCAAKLSAQLKKRVQKIKQTKATESVWVLVKHSYYK